MSSKLNRRELLLSLIGLGATIPGTSRPLLSSVWISLSGPTMNLLSLYGAGMGCMSASSVLNERHICRKK